MIELKFDGISDNEIDAMVDDILRINERAIELTAIEVWGKTKDETPIDEGILAASWRLRKIDRKEWNISTGIEYAIAVHEGTGPRDDLPFAPIALWAKRKHLSPGDVWQSIRTHGTKANPFADRAISATEKRTGEFIRKAMAEMAGGG